MTTDPDGARELPWNPLVTFGHGTCDRAQLSALLRDAGVRTVVDVRIAPGSRRNPDVLRDRLEQWMPAEGIGYRWDPRLGGRRRPAADSPDVHWRNDSFRGYAGHTREPEFRAAMTALDGDLAGAVTAVMCGESVWWRCHRRIIADYAALVLGRPVRHLMHDGRLTPHPLTPGVRRRTDGLLVYDGPD